MSPSSTSRTAWTRSSSIADRATILRDGRHVITAPLSEFTLESMIEQIVGRARAASPTSRGGTSTLGEPLVELRGVSGAAQAAQRRSDVHRGEVVGVAGLLGSGRSALARVLCGVDPLTSGEIRITGKPVKIANPRDAIAAGIALVPEDRRRQGFVAEHSVASNICLPVLDQLCRVLLGHGGQGRGTRRKRRSSACASRRHRRQRRSGRCPAATRRRSSSPNGWRPSRA